jgi:NADPH2:quinone reductase
MRALRIFDTTGSARAQYLNDLDVNDLAPGEVVVRVQYSSVNYKDALAATGAGKVVRRFPINGGIDLAGTVESSTDARFSSGQSVLATGYDLGVAHDGGYAELARVPADWIVAIPEGLTARDAMGLGTAGFTAGLSIVEMERNGLTPEAGPVIVTGATGGVGIMALQLLAARGYRITALTGKPDEADRLRSLGASEVLIRGEVQMGTRPLEKATWAGAVDVVGGDTLAWLTRTTAYGGCIASSGLTGGADLHTTVMPFILRGVKLLGIDSAMCPMPRRQEVWRRLATDLAPKHLSQTTQEITIEGLADAFNTLLAGQARGRYVVKVA